MPAVDEHKEKHLEGEGNDHRRQHEHAHGHEHGGGDHIDDQKRHEDHETDLKGHFELGNHKGRDQGHGGHVFEIVRPFMVRDIDQQLEILLPDVGKHEFPHGLHCLGECLFFTDLFVEIGLQGLIVHALHHRRHDEDGQKQGQPDNHLIGRHIAHAHGLAHEGKDDDHPDKGCGHEQDSGSDSQDGQSEEDLEGHGNLLRVTALPHAEGHRGHTLSLSDQGNRQAKHQKCDKAKRSQRHT